MRSYQNARRNRLLTGSNLGLVGGGVGAAAPGAVEMPIIYNFEGDTIGETGTQLAAKDTHFGLRDVAAVRASDYDILNGIYDARLAQALCNAGTTCPYATITLPAGAGFVPSAGGEVILEMIVNASGTGSRANFYWGSEDDDDGLTFEVYGNSYHYVKTKTGGSWDPAWKIGPYGIGVIPLSNQDWDVWQIKYRYSDNRVQARMFHLAASPSFDSGWKTIGTVSSPSFNASKEHTRLTVAASNNTGATCGIAQARIADFAVSGAGNGEAGTHNYRDLIT